MVTYIFAFMKNSPLLALFITIFIDLLGFGLIIPILPTFSKELGASDLQIGLIAGVYSLMNFIFAPLWGTLSDRIGRRPVILFSICITGFAYLLFANINGLLILLLSRVLAGIGSANISAAQAYISDITTPENRAKNMGMIGAAFGLGFIFGPPVGGFLKSTYGIGMVGYVAAILCIINLVMAYFSLPESIKEKNKSKKFTFKPISELARELRKPIISELFTINFIFIAAFSMMQITAALLWREQYGLDEKQIGYMFMYIGILSAIIQGGLVGKLTKTFGEKKLLIYGNVLMMIGLALIPFAPKELFLVVELVALAIIALANGCLTPSITSLLSQTADKKEQGQVLGLNQSFGSLARVVGPAVGGLLYGLNYHSPYLMAAALMIISLVVANILVTQKLRANA